MDFTSQLHELISYRNSAPLLFIGSGFSRRYIGLEDWHGLLSKFCTAGKSFQYYLAKANGITPVAAKYLSEDYYSHWWNDSALSHSKDELKEHLLEQSSPLKIEISKYLKNLPNPNPTNAHNSELELLAKCDVDGIITTNWDPLLENIFPQYKVYIGQKELLFSNPMQIGEIYKIHGCCSNPNSLILTDADYQDYNNRNAYLAAKLITLFIEHHVIFIGYSISDNNIQDLLKSIAKCIGFGNLSKLQDNLIFLDRNEPKTGPTIENSFLHFDGTQIPIKVIKSNDYSPVYDAIGKIERRLPARVLRFCKERIFDLIKTSNPEKKIAVIDYEKIKDQSEVEVVFGLGVIGKLGDQGYTAITTNDIFEDFINGTNKYDSSKLLEITIPNLHPMLKFIPIYFHLKKHGITQKKIALSKLNVCRFLLKKEDYFQKGTESSKRNAPKKLTLDFLKNSKLSTIAATLPKIETIDQAILHDWLKSNINLLHNKSSENSFRRIAAYYDWFFNKLD